MIKKIDWPKLRGTLPLHQKIFLDYISRLGSCVESYKNGEINVDTALKTCKIILHEIDDPEFPFFAVKNFRELLSIIFYQLPKISALRRAPTLQSKIQRKLNWWKIPSYDGIEKREYERIKPRTTKYFARFRVKQYEGQEMFSPDWETGVLRDISVGGVLFFYNKDLGIGTLLDWKIYLTKDAHIMNCVGKILRSDELQSTSMFFIANKFIEIGEREKKLITKVVENNLE